MCSLSLASRRGYILQPQPQLCTFSTSCPVFCSFSILLPQICCLFCFLCLCLVSSRPSGKMSAWMSFSIRLSVSAACWCSCFSTMESSSSLIPAVKAPKYLLSSEKDDTEPPGSFYHHYGQKIYIWALNFIFCYSHDGPTLMIVSTLMK